MDVVDQAFERSRTLKMMIEGGKVGRREEGKEKGVPDLHTAALASSRPCPFPSLPRFGRLEVS